MEGNRIKFYMHANSLRPSLQLTGTARHNCDQPNLFAFLPQCRWTLRAGDCLQLAWDVQEGLGQPALLLLLCFIAAV